MSDIPLGSIPEVKRLELIAKWSQEQDSVISRVTVSMPAKNKLQEALNQTNLWPRHLQSDDARFEASAGSSAWSEADSRAILCIVRNCRELTIDLVGLSFFPKRPDYAVPHRFTEMLKVGPPGWDTVDDDVLLGLFEAEGDEFTRFAERNFNKQYRAYQLEAAHAIAWRKKYGPSGIL